MNCTFGVKPDERTLVDAETGARCWSSTHGNKQASPGAKVKALPGVMFPSNEQGVAAGTRKM